MGRQEVFLIRPGERVSYEADAQTPWTYAWIGFEGEGAERLLQAAGFSGTVRTAALPEMREFFQSLKQEEDGALLSPLMLCGRLYELFDWLRQRQAGTAALPAPERYARRRRSISAPILPAPSRWKGWPVPWALTGGIFPGCSPKPWG